jgi:hypothetical protein
VYCLWTTLQLCKEHQQDTYVLFLDLIKAFDMGNHDLLFAILGKYGAPAPLVDVIRQLHNNFQLKLVFDKKNQTLISYTVRVRQGDNMAGDYDPPPQRNSRTSRFGRSAQNRKATID